MFAACVCGPPKVNGYQSLHSTLFGPFGTPIEIQIRTHEMHRIAEAGVASHWLYKSGHDSINDLHSKTHQWLQELLESLSQSSDSSEFLEHLKVDLFPDEVYVFTPKGKILSLPRGATGVDFAYSVRLPRASSVLRTIPRSSRAWRKSPTKSRQARSSGNSIWKTYI